MLYIRLFHKHSLPHPKSTMLSSEITLFLFLACLGGAFSQDYVLEGVAQSPWGTWGEMEICPQGSYVFGIRLKVHTDQGVFEDDTALNGVDFLCIGATQRNSSSFSGPEQITTVRSKVGHKGGYGPLLECPEPSFAVGFELRSEKPDAIGPLGDDTAANNLRVICDDSPDIPTRLEGYGTNWGDWMPALKCPRSMRICGIQTKVEDPNGDDDTTMNNLNVGCCA